MRRDDPNGARLFTRRESLLAGCAACLAACRPPPPDEREPVDAEFSNDAPVCELDVETIDVPDPRGCPPRRFTYAGDVKDFCYGLTIVEELAVIVGRDLRGFWALTAACPHFGSPLTPEGAVIRCLPPLGHDSTFTKDGVALSGVVLEAVPPDIANYAVHICDGKVYVRRDEAVRTGTRVCA